MEKTIKYIIDKYGLKGMTIYLCECIGVSKSGYYNYLRKENKRILIVGHATATAFLLGKWDYLEIFKL